MCGLASECVGLGLCMQHSYALLPAELTHRGTACGAVWRRMACRLGTLRCVRLVRLSGGRAMVLRGPALTAHCPMAMSRRLLPQLAAIQVSQLQVTRQERTAADHKAVIAVPALPECQSATCRLQKPAVTERAPSISKGRPPDFD
jgi:hypothetical protein